MRIIQSITKSILSEFQLRKFTFNHNQVDQFYRSQWQSGQRSIVYLLYRWIWALFFIGVFAASLVLQFSDGKLFIFLTNWGILLCLLTQLLAAILVTRWHFNVGNVRWSDGIKMHAKQTTCLVKFYWLVHGVTLTLALVITTIYWMFLHGKMNKPMRYPRLSFVTHCLNSVCMLVDLLVVAFPVRVLHTLYSMLLPITYCLFTVVYFFCGGRDEYGNHYVYPILDWSKPADGLITFAGVFCLYIIYGLAVFAVYKLRRSTHRALTVVRAPQIDGLI